MTPEEMKTKEDKNLAPQKIAILNEEKKEIAAQIAKLNDRTWDIDYDIGVLEKKIEEIKN